MFPYTIPFTVASAILFCASIAFAHSGGQAVAIFTEKPPVIDGVDDWPQEVWTEAQTHDMHMKPEDVPDWFLFPETSPNRISRGVIDDNNDLSVEFAFMFDQQWFYYIGKFVDDNVPDDLQSFEAENQGDLTGPQWTGPHTSMWWLEFDFEHDAPRTPEGNDDRQLALQPDCRYQPGDHFYALKPWTGEGQTEPACLENHGQNSVLGFENRFDPQCTSNMAANRTADGFIIEGKFNFQTLFEQSRKPNLPLPTDGTIWGFDSTATDVESKGGPREGAISWASSFENDNTTCILGDLRFVGMPEGNPTIIEFDPSLADVNADGVVDLFDLAVVASQFGGMGENLTADVTRDGVVNLFDLVFVGSRFGQRKVEAP